MILHWLQHVPFEGLGHIETWARKNGVELSCTRCFANELLPDTGTFDLLVVMGGPMGVHDEKIHPWIADEKTFIASSIEAGKPILGICLGAQLLADVLGASVYPGPHKEIGWFPIQREDETSGWLSPETTVFHWHGDTFDIPKDARLLARSEAGINQGFVYNDRVVGLQFHLETTQASMEMLIENCAHELVDGPYIQSAQQMRRQNAQIPAVNDILENLLNSLSFPSLES